MKNTILSFFLLISFIAAAQVGKNNLLFSVGLNYRQAPIDVEDAPRGAYSSNGDFYGQRFWQTFSLLSSIGINLKNNWQLSLSNYARYNHFHWLERSKFGMQQIPVELQNIKERKNFKYDIFFDASKKIGIKKNKERYLLASGGIGLVNINTKYNVYFKKDTTPSGIIFAEQNFNGNLLRVAPRISVGYQYEKIKATIDVIVVEGPDLTNLTSLWLGATISYEIVLGNKRSIRQNVKTVRK